ncbi:MAG: GIY-YIG nuclease family protein [Ignavibacteriae bacterium]|nr:GIY-YIG nuclease family protein [Ignavibacteriota bacterium]
MYHVYVLKSLKDGKLYIGQTGNLEKRLLKHNSGMCKSTKSRLPLELIYKEEYNTRSEAIKREKELKFGKGRDFLNGIINSG